MKELNSNITTLLIIFLSLKLIDFSNLEILDIIILVLLAVSIILTIMDRMMKHETKRNS